MHRRQNIPLSTLTTMRVGGPARWVVTVESMEQLREVVASCQRDDEPFFILGGGSNLIARDRGYAGVIIVNRIQGFSAVADGPDFTTIRFGAGVVWDEAVEQSVAMGLSGIEALSAIPGTVGAAPVQNIGAYGQEIAQTLLEVQALDTRSMKSAILSHRDCGFAYRQSIFKSPQSRHHIIASVTLKLRKHSMQPPFYASLQTWFEQNQITDFSPAQVRQAVIAIRKIRLPDPSQVANCGSFFKNPIVEADQARTLAARYPDMPAFPAADARVKLSAGWLLERAGLKGHAHHGFMTSPHNALVVINQSGGTFAALERFKNELVNRVLQTFGVRLEQEPDIL